MDGRIHAWSAVLTTLLLAGCQGPQVATHIDSVNAEYRQLEDYVYCLEDENLRLQQELEHAQANHQRGRSAEPARGGLFRRTPRTESAEPAGPSDPGLPNIEMPNSPGNTPPRSSTLQKPASDVPESLDLAPPSVELPAPSEPAPLPPPVRPTDGKVTHITLNSLLTGGIDLDGQAGDDGLSVVIEPRNAAEQLVPDAGAVSVVVLDPSRQGEAARVARWDFDLSATRSKLQATAAAPGITLQMPWPAEAPKSTTLQLFVRYESPDGRKLESSREIYIAPLGQASQRWTPRPPERQRSAEVARVPVAGEGKPGSGGRKHETESGKAGTPKLLEPPPALSGGGGAKPPAPAWSPNR
ncbi:MAG: hypothetical protein SFU86_12300 [Pirellulaceae bacterium]|nr:hypothetical protein [Pirellulaceae bacterium]